MAGENCGGKPPACQGSVAQSVEGLATRFARSQHLKRKYTQKTDASLFLGSVCGDATVRFQVGGIPGWSALSRTGVSCRHDSEGQARCPPPQSSQRHHHERALWGRASSLPVGVAWAGWAFPRECGLFKCQSVSVHVPSGLRFVLWERGSSTAESKGLQRVGRAILSSASL